MPKIQDHHDVTRKVHRQEMLQAIAAVTQADPLLGSIHAHLGCLPTQLQSQFAQVVKTCQVTRLHLRFFIRLKRTALGQVRHWIEHHRHIRHATLRGDAARALLRHTGRVEADISAGFAAGILMPLPRRRAA